MENTTKGRYKNTRSSETIEPSKIHKPIIGKYVIIDGKEVFIEKNEDY